MTTPASRATAEKSEVQHTAGPFEVQDPMGSDVGFWIVQSDLEAYEWSCIAIVPRDEDRSGKHFITKAEQKANAALFSAAPEMLEALKAFVTKIDPAVLVERDLAMSPLAGELRTALAAIAKAEGRS